MGMIYKNKYKDKAGAVHESEVFWIKWGYAFTAADLGNAFFTFKAFKHYADFFF